RIAVERQRLAAEELPEPTFRLLAPAWVIDVGIHVRKESIFRRPRLLPGVVRLILDELHPHDRLDALEAVLPRYDQTNRRAVLIWQYFTVKADGQDRERMHRFVHAQTLGVG